MNGSSQNVIVDIIAYYEISPDGGSKTLKLNLSWTVCDIYSGKYQ